MQKNGGNTSLHIPPSQRGGNDEVVAAKQSDMSLNDCSSAGQMATWKRSCAAWKMWWDMVVK